MTTEQRLREALDARAATAVPNAEAFGRIRLRARRRRTIATLRVAGAAAAFAVVVAGTAVAVGGDRAAPPVVTQPSPEPTREPSAEPTKEPTEAPPAQPTPPVPFAALPPGTHAVAPGDFVALVEHGSLVTVSATTGKVTWRAPIRSQAHEIVLAPDRRSVFLVTSTHDSTCDGRIEQVDLGTGTRVLVGYGSRPDVSPDGTRLAFRTGCGNQWLAVRDLRNGDERRIRHREVEVDAQGNVVEGTGPWTLDRAVWQADSTHLWVNVLWENHTELRVLDPATATSTADARKVPTRYSTFHLERRGDGLAYLHSCCYADATGDDLVVVRDAGGVERPIARTPHNAGPHPIAAGPGGDVLYVEFLLLFRVDAATGEKTRLGEATGFRDW